MGSEELGANIFRITQTEAKLKNDNVQTQTEANKTHYKVGKIVRNAIKQAGSTKLKNLPTPKKSFKQFLKKENKQDLTKK